MEQWWTAVVIVLCLTLPGGCCKETDVLTENQPTGPNMCQMKCQLNKNCADIDFNPHTLKCVLYKKSRTENEENTTGGGKSSPGWMREIHQQMKQSIPANLKRLADECEVAGSKDNSECLADRRDQLRCVKSVQPVTRSEDEMFDCGQCTSPGKQNTNYKSCRCKLGCSKKIKGHKATCHRRCETYGASFTMTQGKGIALHNRLAMKAGRESCKNRCNSEKSFTCLSMEYHIVALPGAVTCHLQNVSWFDVHKGDRRFNDYGWEFYHRDCN